MGDQLLHDLLAMEQGRVGTDELQANHAQCHCNALALNDSRVGDAESHITLKSSVFH